MGSAREEVLNPESVLREGHYAAKQIFCRDRLIAWSHRRRFDTGLALAHAFGGRRLLDYGCGDGTFLALLSSTAARPSEGVGAELDSTQVNDCRTRLGEGRGLSFVSIDSLDDPAHRGQYDVVVCMEVLEHVVDLDPVIDRLWRLLAADGTLLVSVPVETGLPLLVKQAARRVAGWRGIGDYPGTSPYTWREYLASASSPGSSRTSSDRSTAEPRRFTITRASTGWRCAIVSRGASRSSVSSPLRSRGSVLASRRKCGSSRGKRRPRTNFPG